MVMGVGNRRSLIRVCNYAYGELGANGEVLLATNTGNIGKITLSFAGLANPLVQRFKYDSLYRLTEATERAGTETSSPQNWIQNFGYDRYGNRTSTAQNIGGIVNNQTPAVDPLTNRFTSPEFVYDKNGNVIRDANPTNNQSRSFVFNGDNKQTEVKDANGNPVGKYFYDGEGKRVKKETNLETTVFVYSAGKLVAEYSTKLSQNPTTSYTTTDHLGTPRVITDELGQVKARRDFMPFGEELTINVGERSQPLKYGTNADDVRQKFTGYQKDEETKLEFAEARMYENRYARFTAVDPLLASGIATDPQSFNRYVYCTNNPIKYVDKSGLYPTDIHDKLLELAFPGATSAQLSALQYGSRSVDTTFGTGRFIDFRPGIGGFSFSLDFPRTVIPSEAFKHAMIQEGMTRADGIQKTNEYITSQVNKAISDQYDIDPNGNAISISALVEFGKAAHPMMDGISPSHRFFQSYGLEIAKGYGFQLLPKFERDIRAAIDHSNQESAFPPMEDRLAAIRLMRLNLLTGLGDNVFRQLVPDEAARQEIYDMVEVSNGRFIYRTGVPVVWAIGSGPYRGLSVPQNQTELDDELGPPPPLIFRRP